MSARTTPRKTTPMNTTLTTLAATLTATIITVVPMAAIHTTTAADTVESTPAVALASTVKISAFDKSLLKAVNLARATKHVCAGVTYKPAKPVAWNTKLAKAAEGHSTEMATKNYLSHNSANGASAFTRIKSTGYRYTAAGENIAAGYNTPASIVKAWLASPEHCKVLMNKAYTQIGTGYYTGAGLYQHYTTADFGKPAK